MSHCVKATRGRIVGILMAGCNVSFPSSKPHGPIETWSPYQSRRYLDGLLTRLVIRCRRARTDELMPWCCSAHRTSEWQAMASAVALHRLCRIKLPLRCAALPPPKGLARCSDIDHPHAAIQLLNSHSTVSVSIGTRRQRPHTERPEHCRPANSPKCKR
jgi:hypothetical protein